MKRLNPWVVVEAVILIAAILVLASIGCGR
jgi:hypothetical protein